MHRDHQPERLCKTAPFEAAQIGESPDQPDEEHADCIDRARGVSAAEQDARNGDRQEE